MIIENMKEISCTAANPWLSFACLSTDFILLWQVQLFQICDRRMVYTPEFNFFVMKIFYGASETCLSILAIFVNTL